MRSREIVRKSFATLNNKDSVNLTIDSENETARTANDSM
jgi:hypothetical protein